VLAANAVFSTCRGGGSRPTTGPSPHRARGGGRIGFPGARLHVIEVARNADATLRWRSARFGQGDRPDDAAVKRRGPAARERAGQSCGWHRGSRRGPVQSEEKRRADQPSGAADRYGADRGSASTKGKSFAEEPFRPLMAAGSRCISRDDKPAQLAEGRSRPRKACATSCTMAGVSRRKARVDALRGVGCRVTRDRTTKFSAYAGTLPTPRIETIPRRSQNA